MINFKNISIKHTKQEKIKLSSVRIFTFDYIHWNYCSIKDNISKRFDWFNSFLSKTEKGSSKIARLRFDDRFDGNFEDWFMTTVSEFLFFESKLKCCVISEYDSILFQTMIHPNPCRLNMLRNWIGFGSCDKESKLNHVLLYFLMHHIWSLLKIITAIMSSHELSLQNNNWTQSVHKEKWLIAFLPEIRRIIWRIIWTLHMKFVQNETDDIVIGMNEKEFSASSTMILHVEFITIPK